MRRVALALGVAFLSGCPIPQAVPEVGRVEGGGVLIPAPRIVPELVRPAGTFIDVSRACAEAPRITFEATLSEFDLTLPDEARWFVDYDPITRPGLFVPPEPLPALPGSTTTYRPVTPLPFTARQWQDPDVAVQVVELVVSNRFLDGPGAALPNRTPDRNHETQVFRWVIRYVTSGGACVIP